MQERDGNFAGTQNQDPKHWVQGTSILGFQFASHDKRVSHGWRKTTYTEEGSREVAVGGVM
jgi:hypothetical protein